jgi:hypothetical protein
MPLSPTDMIQSFRLRFWRESRHGGPEDWRGDVWHEQQEPDEEAVIVANPEAAFELVKHTLQIFSRHDAEIGLAARTERDEFSRTPSRRALPNQQHPLLSIWRRIWGEQP